jgi:galactokinase
VSEAFRRFAGREPDAVRRAPGRVNLIGEHTDYAQGWVLPIAIDLGVTASGARRVDGRLRFASTLEVSDDDEWLRYPDGVAAVLREHGVELPGADVLIESTLPSGAGLSSSAALEVAVALLLVDLAGADIPPLRLALLCRDAEERVAGVPCGPMDQIASVAGRCGHALLVDTRSLSVEPLPLGLEAAGLQLVVVDTGHSHRLADTEYALRRREAEEAARRLGVPSLRDATPAAVEEAATVLGPVLHRRARHVTTENTRVLQAADALRRGAPAEVGPLLDASHASLRDDYEVSSPALDAAAEACRRAGARGARLTGAGFGGSVLTLVPHERVAAVREQVALAPELAERGARVLVVHASDGACPPD